MIKQLPADGITPPLITPLAAADQLDHAALTRIVERSIAGGVTGLFVLGTTGEGPSLSQNLKREVVSRCCQAAAGRVPVLAGLIEASTDDALRLAAHAAEAGADALVWTPPFYYPLPQEAVIAAAERLIPRLPLPVYLYNIPVFTKVPLEPETLARLAAMPQVCGIKDSGGNLEKLARTRALLPTIPILWGPEEIQLEAMRAGATGGVNGGANLFPELFVALYNAIVEGPEDRARQCALEDLGIASPLPAEPLTELSGPPRDQIRRAVASIARQVEESLS